MYTLQAMQKPESPNTNANANTNKNQAPRNLQIQIPISNLTTPFVFIPILLFIPNLPHHVPTHYITLHYITSHTPELPIIFSFRLDPHTISMKGRRKEVSFSIKSIRPSINQSLNQSINQWIKKGNSIRDRFWMRDLSVEFWELVWMREGVWINELIRLDWMIWEIIDWLTDWLEWGEVRWGEVDWWRCV